MSHRYETGATTALPATYSFKRTLNNRRALSIFGCLVSAEIETLILLDGKEVKRATGRGVKAQAVSVCVLAEQTPCWFKSRTHPLCRQMRSMRHSQSRT